MFTKTKKTLKTSNFDSACNFDKILLFCHFQMLYNMTQLQLYIILFTKPTYFTAFCQGFTSRTTIRQTNLYLNKHINKSQTVYLKKA